MLLGMAEADLLNPHIIKVIDGIAGAGKSSALHNFFIKNNIKYARYTSTNRLKMDAEDRYQMPVKTIASGLFRTVNGKFYAEQRKPECDIILIDEVLQTDAEVFEWSFSNIGTASIIILTDSNQTLAPESEAKMKKAFDSFCKDPRVVVSNINVSMRPRTDKTSTLYDFAFHAVGAETNVFDQLRNKLNRAALPSEFDENAVYICHTNDLEEYLYGKYELRNRYDLPLIPKGTIAARPPRDIRKYPIMPQSDTKQHTGYYQIANIATPTRYQGSEVYQGQRLYYLVNPNSFVGNREFYTVITRCQDIEDLYLVIVDDKPPIVLDKYQGAPILKECVARIDRADMLPGNVHTVGDWIDAKAENNKLTLDESLIRHAVQKHVPPKGYVYRTNAAICDGVIISSPLPEKTTARTMPSLLKREGVFDYGYLPEFFKICESKHLPVYGIHGPMLIEEKARHRNCVRYSQYALDLKAAYPHILKYAELPNNSWISETPREGGLDLYVVTGGKYLKWGSIVTKRLQEEIPEEEYAYICTVSSQTGSNMGDWLHEMAHRSVEANDKIKSVHYGYAERQYLKPVEYSGRIPTSYVLRPQDNHGLLMCAIRSELCRIMARLERAISGGLGYSGFTVDCIYFDHDNIEAVSDDLKMIIDPYDFRITDRHDDDQIIYQTYQDLPTEAEYKKMKRRKK